MTVVYTVKGYSRAAGNWFFARYGADGTVRKVQKVEGCNNCCGAKKDYDFLVTSDFVKKWRGGDRY